MARPSRPPLPYDFLPEVPSFDVRSNDVADGQMLADSQVFDGFGMRGGNLSPSLSLVRVPGGDEGFAVTCFDPDAPTGSGFWHWIVLGIPAWVTELAAGAAGRRPGPAQGAFHVRNDCGAKDFGGAAPPAATRRTATCSRCTPWTWIAGRQRRDSPPWPGLNLRFHTIARAVVSPVYGG